MNDSKVLDTVAIYLVAKTSWVNKNQKLGLLLNLEGGKLAEAHFEIWKITSSGMKTENPSYWLKSR